MSQLCHRNLAALHTQAICRLHAMLANLTPGGILGPLTILASRKHGKTGWNLGHFNWQWQTNLQVYRLSGKIRWGTAHAWR